MILGLAPPSFATLFIAGAIREVPADRLECSIPVTGSRNITSPIAESASEREPERVSLMNETVSRLIRAVRSFRSPSLMWVRLGCGAAPDTVMAARDCVRDWSDIAAEVDVLERRKRLMSGAKLMKLLITDGADGPVSFLSDVAAFSGVVMMMEFLGTLMSDEVSPVTTTALLGSVRGPVSAKSAPLVSVCRRLVRA